MKFASSENVDVKKNIIIFLIISLILFFVDRSNNQYLKAARSSINDGIIYSTVVLKSPFIFLSNLVGTTTKFFEEEKVINKNKILDLENQIEKLKNEKTSLILQLENLRKITGEENYPFETVQVKVLMYKSNILHQSIIINKGTNDGIKIGNPLIKNNILVGKIYKTNFNSSHAFLITNSNSRVPVRIGKNNYKAIVVGDSNTNNKLNLEFLPKEYSFNNGDYVYTTSLDNIMPEGIMVGKISLDEKKNFFLEPLYDFSQLDYLTVVKNSK